MTLENNRILDEKSRILNELINCQDQRIIESNRRTRYTIAAISEKIKRDFAIVTFDINEYKYKIAEHKNKLGCIHHTLVFILQKLIELVGFDASDIKAQAERRF